MKEEEEGKSDALRFLRNNLEELEGKLSFWQVDPQIWINDLEGMKNALYFLENRKSPTRVSEPMKNSEIRTGEGASCSTDISVDRPSDLSRICSCNHDEEYEQKSFQHNLAIRDLRNKILAYNKKQEDAIMEIVDKDRVIVGLEETISELIRELNSNKEECQAHISVIQDLTYKVNSHDSLTTPFGKTMCLNPSKLKTDNIFRTFHDEEEDREYEDSLCQ